MRLCALAPWREVFCLSVNFLTPSSDRRAALPPDAEFFVARNHSKFLFGASNFVQKLCQIAENVRRLATLTPYFRVFVMTFCPLTSCFHSFSGFACKIFFLAPLLPWNSRTVPSVSHSYVLPGRRLPPSRAARKQDSTHSAAPLASAIPRPLDSLREPDTWHLTPDTWYSTPETFYSSPLFS